MNDIKMWWRKAWVQNLVWVLLFVVIFFSVRAWQQQAMPKGKAPTFLSTITVSGKPIDLSDYRGKPLMLYFWATWCKICEFEQGSIRSISEDYPVVSVALQSGSATQVGAYMKQHELSMPTAVDEFGEIASRYGVRGTPTAFFIDANGIIRSVEVGYTSEIGMRIRLWLAGL
ncbi:MAG: protein disulfide oxidoreductase [Acidiferrobacterales bacterium]